MNKVESVDIKLNFPIKSSDGRVIERVTIRRLKVRDLKMVVKYETEDQKLFHLLPHLIQESPEDVDNIDVQDWLIIRDKIADFLGASAVASI